MKAPELRKQTRAQLLELLASKQAEAAQIRLEARTKEVKQNHQLGRLRVEVAQIATVLREQELSGKGDKS